MGWYGRKSTKHCRWCGRQYTAHRPLYKDGFDTKACKQALYRAYKKYVTGKRGPGDIHQAQSVTRKKRQK